jgi:hypothetical protein
VINFERFEAKQDRLRDEFSENFPFPYLAIDELCDPWRLGQLVDKIPDPVAANIEHSRDYVFARNKYEKSRFREIDAVFEEICQDLLSIRFQAFLQFVTGEKVFVDPGFHGGGLHQGGPGSFLDMHADFNYHPLQKTWYRNLNILLYLNRNWRKSFGGELKLRHRDGDGRTALVEPLFNRCVIMPTRDYTLHGYDEIHFPVGTYRRSLAAYAYTLTDIPEAQKARSTVWYPEHSGLAKRVLGKHWPMLVRIKGSLLGSGTARKS